MNEVVLVQRDLYLIRLQTMEDKLAVIPRELYYFDG